MHHESTKKAREEEGLETEAADLALQVQATLTVQLESQMRDLEATTCCTVFLLSESGTVKEEPDARRDYIQQQCCQHPAKRGTGKTAPMVLERNAGSHRGDGRGRTEER